MDLKQAGNVLVDQAAEAGFQEELAAAHQAMPLCSPPSMPLDVTELDIAKEDETFKRLYCVYDMVAEECASPAILNNDQQAVRTFVPNFQNPDKNPEDYKLIRLGYINIKTMKIVLETIPVDITPNIQARRPMKGKK